MRYCPLTKKYEDDCGPCEMCPAEQGIEIPLSDLEGGKKLKEENERYARMLIQDTPLFFLFFLLTHTLLL